jgi:hypothetical protein
VGVGAVGRSTAEQRTAARRLLGSGARNAAEAPKTASMTSREVIIP